MPLGRSSCHILVVDKNTIVSRQQTHALLYVIIVSRSMPPSRSSMKRGMDSIDSGTARKGKTTTAPTDDCKRGVRMTARTSSTDTVGFATAVVEAGNRGVAPQGFMKVIEQIDQSGSDFDLCKYCRIYRFLSTPWQERGQFRMFPSGGSYPFWLSCCPTATPMVLAVFEKGTCIYPLFTWLISVLALLKIVPILSSGSPKY